MRIISSCFFGNLIFPVVALAVSGLLVYSNSFNGPFIFDDSQILETPQLHQLFPIQGVIAGTNRPFLNLSLALNYAINGIEVQGYHVVNLAAHIVASLFLLGILRRIFRSPRLIGCYGNRSNVLALIIALFWLIHPLQTGSVTYIIQRAESMMGMFYLGTLYSAIRYFGTASYFWMAVTIVLCALGMATKEVMVTAPVVVIFCENIFWSRSWSEIWTRRRMFYSGLFLTWLLPFGLLTTSHEYQKSVGFGLRTATPLEYAVTQPGVVLHYLKLALFPGELCLDYQWPIATKPEEIIPPLFIILGALSATIWGLQGKRPLAFLGLWFFLILSVTSSFIPIQDLAFEHRMYLPLASVMVLIVLAMDGLLRKYVDTEGHRRVLIVILVLGTTAGLATLTFLRNQDYRSEEVMWRDILKKRPLNLRAHNDLGLALIRAGKPDEAFFYLNRALEINPNYIVPYNNIGLLYLNKGDVTRAREFFSTAIRYKPDYAEAINNLGLVYAQAGDYASARRQYEQAIRVDGHYAESFNNLGVTYLQEKRLNDAQEFFEKAISLKPHYATAYNNLGIIEIYRGRFVEAEKYFRKALSLNSHYAKAFNNLGVAVKNQGRTKEAGMYFVRALELVPNYREAAENLKEVAGGIAQQK